METDDKAYWHALSAAHTDRIRVLQIKAARYGINCPPEIISEINDIQFQLDSINNKIDDGSSQEQPLIDKKPVRILIVDDEPPIVYLMRKLLEHQSYVVFTAFNGLDALRIATIEKPDLIISDMLMPRMNGYELLIKVIERRIPTRFMIVTGLSAYGSGGLVTACLKLGVSDYFTKPFDFEELMEAIRLTLELNPTLDVLFKEPAKLIDNLVKKTADLLHENHDLKSDKRYLTDKLEKLLLSYIRKNEAENIANHSGINPEYYIDLADMYYRLGKSEQELEILERYTMQPSSKRSKYVSKRIKELKPKKSGSSERRKRAKDTIPKSS